MTGWRSTTCTVRLTGPDLPRHLREPRPVEFKASGNGLELINTNSPEWRAPPARLRPPRRLRRLLGWKEKTWLVTGIELYVGDELLYAAPLDSGCKRLHPSDSFRLDPLAVNHEPS